MTKTSNLEIDLDVSGHVRLQETVKKGFEKVDEHLGIGVAIVSEGDAITIPVGSTLSEALQILADAIDPGV